MKTIFVTVLKSCFDIMRSSELQKKMKSKQNGEIFVTVALAVKSSQVFPVSNQITKKLWNSLTSSGKNEPILQLDA